MVNSILTNKSGKGRKGTMVAGNKADTVIEVIEKIPLKKRNLVKEITLDMAGNLALIAKKCFSIPFGLLIVFMYRNSTQKPYRKLGLNTVG
jgi:hypothetical protein